MVNNNIYYQDNKEDTKQKRNFFVSIVIGLSNLIILVADSLITIMVSARNRQRELVADNYAFWKGYGNQLVSALYMLDEIMPDGFIDLKQHVTRTHPYLYDRIAELEDIVERRDKLENSKKQKDNQGRA